MGILQTLLKAKQNSAAANVMYASILKRAKTPEQRKCIDFFLGTEVPEKGKGCGCLKGATWSLDDYTAHVDHEIAKLNLKERAIEKIGLDESQISEIPPIVLSSFLRVRDGAKNVWYKANEDYTKYVTNKFSVTWIFFSATQIYTYTYVLDTMSDDAVEYTRDFFYSDVTCIRTEHEVEDVVYEIQPKGCIGKIKRAFVKFINKLLRRENDFYARYHKHWDTLQITVPSDSYEFCCRTTPTLEQSIQAAKAMIREKKDA